MLLADEPLNAMCQSFAALEVVLEVSGNHLEAKTFQPARKFPGLIQVSTVIAPAVRAVPAGKTDASPVPSKETLAPVESLTRVELPKKEEVAVDEAGFTLFHPAAPVVARDELSLASRFRTKLLVTIAALAVCGTSTATRVLVVSATSATKAGNFPHIWRICL
jgi:hypothetical protein